MIKKLTEFQKSRFPEFVDKWKKIGLSTEPANRPDAEKGIGEIYAAAGLKKPHIVWCSSPLSNGLVRAIIFNSEMKALTMDSIGVSVRDSIRNSVGASVRASVGASVWNSVGASVMASVGVSARDSVWASVRASVGASVWNSVGVSVWDSVGASVGASVWNSVGASVRDSIRNSVGASVMASVGASVGTSGRNSVGDFVLASVMDSVWHSVEDFVLASVRNSIGVSVRDSIGASVRDSVRVSVEDSVRGSIEASVWNSVGASVMASVGVSVRDSVEDSGYGQHDAGWLAFYDYFRQVCGLSKETNKLIGHWLIAQSAGWYLPYRNICWISERHNILKLNSRNRLHCETGVALGYPDGWGVYALNGITMKPEYVLTPKEKITPEMIVKEQNVDQRRELIRKVGIDKLISCGKRIHKEGDYELIDMSPILTGIRYAPYLLMKNPSVEDTWHLEGVSPVCRTVEQAINWRAGNIEIQWQPYQLS